MTSSLGLPSTSSSRFYTENILKRPSPEPPKQQTKRRRVANEMTKVSDELCGCLITYITVLFQGEDEDEDMDKEDYSDKDDNDDSDSMNSQVDSESDSE